MYENYNKRTLLACQHLWQVFGFFNFLDLSGIRSFGNTWLSCVLRVYWEYENLCWGHPRLSTASTQLFLKIPNAKGQII